MSDFLFAAFWAFLAAVIAAPWVLREYRFLSARRRLRRISERFDSHGRIRL
jgi:hypothetical protein